MYSPASGALHHAPDALVLYRAPMTPTTTTQETHTMIHTTHNPLRITLETYEATKTFGRIEYHNIDVVGSTTYNKSEAKKTATGLQQFGYNVHIVPIIIGGNRYCIFVTHKRDINRRHTP